MSVFFALLGGITINKQYFDYLTKNEPVETKKKYLFLVDNQDIALLINYNGYTALHISDSCPEYFNVNEFTGYLASLIGSGRCHFQYIYVPALSNKSWNDKIEECCSQNTLHYRKGWMLFREKEYLEKIENQKELVSILDNFIDRFERLSSDDTNLDRFHRFNEQGKRIGIFDMEIVEHLINTVPFFVIDGVPFIYEKGVYQEDRGGIQLRSHVQALLYKECIKSTVIQAIYNLLVHQASVQKRFSDVNNQPAHWINFRNGYFDVITWTLHEHSPTYIMINQIPFSFDLDKPIDIDNMGQNLQKYLSVSMPEETDQKMFWQYLGYCMTTDTRFQKFLMIKGKGGTGKSVAVALIQHIIGINNSSSISLQDLNKRFYATGLFGKLLNACADIPSAALQNVDVIKKAVGEDTLLYEKKGQDPTHFHSYAKLLFSANEMPLNLDDKTNAYYRRLLVLDMDMNQNIPEKDKDIRLKEKILQETDYAIFMAVHQLKLLYENNQFTESVHSQNCVEELYRSADSVKAFLDEKITRHKGDQIKRSDMYQYYTDYCEENDRQAHGKSVFFRMMKEKGFSLKRSNQGWFYENIGLKEEGFIPLDHTEDIPFEQINLVTK